MFKKLTITALTALTLGAGGAWAAEGGHVTDYKFSFEGPFGKYDQAQLQRGLQIYTQICSVCHGLKFVPLRSLSEPGGPSLSDDAMRAYAETFEVFDPELDDYRTAKPTDHFPEGTYPGAPDLSLMAKGRAGFHGPLGTGISQFFKGMGGPEYITSYLLAFTDETKEEAGTLYYQNPVFSTGWSAMPPQLFGDDVEYADGTEATMEQEAKDIAAFLMWTAEPKLMARKEAGVISVLFLGVLTVLLYLTNKRLWAPYKPKKQI
ncbi:cytochrome c1 [Rhodovulum sulfidophilum]|uniref:Cytochrome c1 n=1 Tax=Rhodovulum sulfidophilum TaxID=35806 RepID=A0A0D6B8F4_RHOSU|nr:cytochrome c1 [Rhodovulum sulfidophilum]ANB33362.1 cytochrome C [Rhodovulum sulfidophilum DSM 1374]ANB37183.1 cytochrome C [Rhodovulum sulfidophilum]MBK5925515.1 cytochrome c1 [Rhodovulum sulfidophilum]MBL3554297.1 cytochrome c1 [Rhodovulum sulfidophilum]MBL3562213.1 cytochrome c1 [Rhodovulum sulfidophilum]